MAEVVKTAIIVNQRRQESFAGLKHSCSDLHIPSSLTFALHMTYWLNNQGIISPHHTFVLSARYNVIPGIFMLTLLSLSHPLLFLYYSTQWCLCLPFWTAEQKTYPKQTNQSTSTWSNVIIVHTNKVHMNRNGQLNMSGTLHTQADVSWPCNTTLEYCGTPVKEKPVAPSPEIKRACFITQSL